MTISIGLHAMEQPFGPTLVEYNTSPVVREYGVATPNAATILSLYGLVGSKNYI
jgi:hypothetical protein